MRNKINVLTLEEADKIIEELSATEEVKVGRKEIRRRQSELAKKRHHISTLLYLQKIGHEILETKEKEKKQ